MLSRFPGAKAAIIAAVAVLCVAGIAGATAGALPRPAQQVADRMLRAVSVTAPGQAQDRSPNRPDAAGVPKGRLCHAWLAGQNGQQGAIDNAELEALATAAGGPDKIAAYCQGTAASQEGATASQGQAAGQGQAEETTTTSGTTPATASTGQGQGGEPRVLPTGRYIVVLRDSVTSPAAVAHSHARQHGGQLGFVYSAAIKGYSATLPEAAVPALRTDPLVAAVVEDREVHVAAQTLPTGIDRIDGELSSTASGDGAGSVDVDIAVIDTGIDTNHPDLNVVGGVACNGNSVEDRNGHGTHVAGIAAARDNSVGTVGVAPGARLWAVRVLNSNGKGSWSNVICGVDWVTANAGTIEVANMSLGGGGAEPPGSGCSTGDALHDAICRSVAAGVTYVVAAGNSSANAQGFVPAAYDEVITVSALADFNGQPGGGAPATCRADSDDTLADSSNFGSDVDLVAPGVCIYSTYRGDRYATLSGTSMASPHVTGAAALYKASNPTGSPSEVSSALQGTGNLDWNSLGDPDGIKEQLLNVDAF
jgi:subtilisin family serine protease